MSSADPHFWISRRERGRLVAILVFFFSLTLPTHADWPHLRGPNYDGVSAERGLANAWPAQGPPRLWTRELGQGYSGFIVAEGKLYSYYEGCKTIGMFVAWSFLVGFPFAFPLTFLAVRAALKERRAWIIVVWTALAFTMFFWSAQALLLWKASA